MSCQSVAMLHLEDQREKQSALQEYCLNQNTFVLQKKSQAKIRTKVAMGSYSLPMRASSLLSSDLSRVAKGKFKNSAILRSSATNVSRNARSSCAAPPAVWPGSGIPQCVVLGCPGQTGQASLAALSQTVNTKSIRGAPGGANSSQLL